MALPKRVRLVEVGPRDGLQNEAQPLTAADRVQLIERLAEAGVSYIEAGSFVSPSWVPQMAASEEVFAGLTRRPGVVYAALAPNLKGFERALAAGVDEIAVFAAASEAFSQRNTNCSIAESMVRFQPVVEAAREHSIAVRGYVSCAVGCPYSGPVAPQQALPVARDLYQMGCYEVALADTTGVGTPAAITGLIEAVAEVVPVSALGAHCHDTYGQALANIYAALQLGVASIDGSVAGLGGCPYAPGSAGNVASEDVLYMLQGLGIEAGIDLDKMIEAGHFICGRLGRETQSRVARARRRFVETK